MSTVAGIDFNTRTIDIVLLNEDTNHAQAYACDLDNTSPFAAALSVPQSLPGRSWWEDQQVTGIWIEHPFARYLKSMVPLMRVQGAILATLPPDLVAGELTPQTWKRQTVGHPNATKADVAEWALGRWADQPGVLSQDTLDAYAIAWAGRALAQQAVAA